MEYFLTRLVLFLKDKANNRDTIIKIISIIAIIGGFMYLPDACRSCANSTQHNTTISDLRIDAYIASKNVINSVLKTPYTAKYQSYDASMVSVSGNMYTVTGYVDSQNSFGAMLRAKYTVVLRSSGSEWLTESVIFNGKILK